MRFQSIARPTLPAFSVAPITATARGEKIASRGCGCLLELALRDAETEQLNRSYSSLQDHGIGLRRYSGGLSDSCLSQREDSCGKCARQND